MFNWQPPGFMWIVGHSHVDPSFLAKLRSPWTLSTRAVSLSASLLPPRPSPVSESFAPRQDWAGLWQVNRSPWCGSFLRSQVSHVGL